MKNAYCNNNMIKKYIQQHPTIILLALFIIHYISAYPGGMTPDSEDQFNQSLTLQFNSHHPPIMAMLWSVFNLIYAGPQTMLFFHLVIFWVAIWFLFNSDENNKFRWLYFVVPFTVVPFTPNVLTLSGMIWKDIGFANCFFFVFAAYVYYASKKQRPPIAILTILFLAAFYGTLVKFQAKFILPVLMLFVAFTLYESWKKRITACLIISTIIILANSLIIRYFTGDSHSEQMRQLFDLAGIAVDINKDDVFPGYIKENPIYSFDKLKKYYTPRWIDPFVFAPKSAIFNTTQNEKDLAALNNAFFNAVKKYPLSYLKHRAKNFNFMIISHLKLCVDSTFYIESNKYKFHVIKNNLIQKFFVSYISKTPKNLIRNIVSVILLIIYVLVIGYYRKNKNYLTESNVLIFLFTLCVFFSLVLFFTTMAADYRYYTLVRVMTFCSIPIFLNFVYKQYKLNIRQ